MTAISELLDELRKPFHPSHITWKPGAIKGDRALAMPYADLRAYMNRLDEVCDGEWGVAYEPWGEDRIICRLTIAGVTRSSTGETTNESEKSEIGGTVAEAQSFKRAAAMFGLGRYLYNLPTGWVDWDAAGKKFTEKAKAKLMGILVQHYRRATESKVELEETYTGNAESEDTDTSTDSALFNEFNALGESLYGKQWPQVRQRNVKRMSGGNTTDPGELAPEQVQQLIDGMKKLKQQRTPMGEPQDAPTMAQQATVSDKDTSAVDSPSNYATPLYAHLIDKLTGDCLERANRARKIHAQSKGPATPEQYRFLAGTIDDIVRQMGGHKAILEVFVGRVVSSANPPGIQLAGKLLDALLAERTVERDGEKVNSIFNLTREQDGQASLFEQQAVTA